MILPAAAVLGAAALAAQQPEEEHAPPLERPIVERLLPEVTSRLRSDKPDSVAWGAYLAGRFRLAEAQPEVLAASGRDHGGDIQGRLTRLHLLDSLVRLEVAAPPELLAANRSGMSLPPALVLMARQPVANREALRDLFEEHAGPRGDSMVWRAAGNLLAAQQAPGFAVHLLEDTTFELHLTVSDPEGRRIGFD